jgi:mono/diheme cytochrome c family protein
MSRQVALFGLCFALAACAEMGASGTPAGTGTPVAKGQATAERVCGLCHQVLLNKPSEIEAAAPSFMEIANLPGRNRNYLRQFMVERHNVETLGEPAVPMPTETLAAEEREDVIAYLLGFQTDPKRANQPPTKLEPFE